MAKKNNNKKKLELGSGVFSLLGSEFGWPAGINPSGNKMVDEIALKLITDAKDIGKNYRSLTKWCLDNGIFPEEFKRYRDKYQTAEFSAQFALAIFGERREERIGSGQDKDSLAWVLPQYNQVWKAERNERAALKKEIEVAKINQFFPLPTPELPKEEDNK